MQLLSDTSEAPRLAWDASPIAAALQELRRGRMVLVVDDEDRENEGDLIMGAEYATPEALAFMIRHTSGIICVAMEEGRADALKLERMVRENDDPRGTAFTVSVDLKGATTTGVSAADRSLTIQALADPSTLPAQLSRPGHVFPLVARPGGVLQRAGHTESAADLCRLAGLVPVGILAEVTNDDGTMARRAELAAFAEAHDLVSITVADIVRHRRVTESLIRREAAARVPTDHGEFTAVTYRSVTDNLEHVAFVHGDVTAGSEVHEPVLVRVHSECLTGDVFGSRRCDCGEQLDRAMARIAEAGRGVVVYLRGHEGRGIGLTHKLRAYNLQDRGLDTVEANLAQGLPVDSREFGIGAQILEDLGIEQVVVMTNNPAKYRGLGGYRVEIVGREPLVVVPNPENLAYLDAKRARLQHTLVHDVAATSTLAPLAPSL